MISPVSPAYEVASQALEAMGGSWQGAGVDVDYLLPSNQRHHHDVEDNQEVVLN